MAPVVGPKRCRFLCSWYLAKGHSQCVGNAWGSISVQPAMYIFTSSSRKSGKHSLSGIVILLAIYLTKDDGWLLLETGIRGGLQSMYVIETPMEIGVHSGGDLLEVQNMLVP